MMSPALKKFSPLLTGSVHAGGGSSVPTAAPPPRTNYTVSKQRSPQRRKSTNGSHHAGHPQSRHRSGEASASHGKTMYETMYVCIATQ